MYVHMYIADSAPPPPESPNFNFAMQCEAYDKTHSSYAKFHKPKHCIWKNLAEIIFFISLIRESYIFISKNTWPNLNK